MPFAKKRRFSKKGHGKRFLNHRGKGRFKTHIKNVSGFYPETTLVVAALNTDYLPFVGANPAGQLSVPLNALYRPTNFCQVRGGIGTNIDCPPNLYFDSVTSCPGLLGSFATGAPYRQYKVLGCHVKYEIVNRTALTQRFQGFLEPALLFAAAPPAYFATLNVDQNQKHHFDLLVPSLAAQGKPTIYRKYFGSKEMYGRTKAQIAADYGDIGATDSIAVTSSGVGSGTWANENPSTITWLTARLTTIDGGALANSDASVRICMKWYVQLFTRNYTLVPDVPTALSEEKKLDDYEEDDMVDVGSPLPALEAAKRLAPIKDSHAPQAASVSNRSPLSALGSPMKRLKM